MHCYLSEKQADKESWVEITSHTKNELPRKFKILVNCTKLETGQSKRIRGQFESQGHLNGL